jgi:Zn-dependent peptidase ImmA (M78 family)
MPESQCKLDLFGLKYKDLGLRKQYWKVSKAALIHRAQELNCIPAQTAQYLYITLGRNGERKNESVNVSIDEPQILKKMTDLHVTELKYTMEELSDIVGLGIQEIRSSLMGENKTISLRPAKISLSF